MARTYKIATVTGSLPTIIDADSGRSILAIDERTVDGKRYSTPAFANPKVAERILAALNAE